MNKYKFDHKVIEWIKAFLPYRYQQTIVASCYSPVGPVSSGIPQGSVLGPILFLVYINDIASVVKNSHVKLFADDSKLYIRVSSSDDCQLLQDDLLKVYEWTESWQLTLSVPKCELLRLNPHPNVGPFGYNVANNLVPSVSKARDLGVIVGPDLKFKEHISSICK